MLVALWPAAFALFVCLWGCERCEGRQEMAMDVSGKRASVRGWERREGWLVEMQGCGMMRLSVGIFFLPRSGVEYEGRGCAGATEGSVPASWTAFQLRYGHAFGFITNILVFMLPTKERHPRTDDYVVQRRDNSSPGKSS